MKKLLIALLCAMLLAFSCAMAEEVPEGIRLLLRDDNQGLDLPIDCVVFPLENGRKVAIAITDGFSLDAFEYVGEDITDEVDTGMTTLVKGWRFTMQTGRMDEMCGGHLANADTENLTVDIVSKDGQSRLSYRFDGTQFRLIGWQFPGYPTVHVEGETLWYDGVETILPGGVDDFPWNMDDLPLTMKDALEMAAITEQNIADMFPGYTLRWSDAWDGGVASYASYTRIAEGYLMIQHVSFEKGMTPSIRMCMSVPLSETLLKRLETEPFDELIDATSGACKTFRTQDAYDRVRLGLPEDAVILDNTVHENSIIAICEVDGLRYLYVWEQDGQGYSVRRTQPLPADANLDTFHTGDGGVEIEWGGQNRTIHFFRQADGQWRLSWYSDYTGEGDVYYGAYFWGLEVRDDLDNDRYLVGSFDRDLFTIDLNGYFPTEPVPDTSGWAVVNNPDPADRLHLRVSADRASRSLGKFYNGTPVQVLSRGKTWTKVRVGLGETARVGWMMTKYLAFGDDMQQVDRAFPDLIFREEYEPASPLNGGYAVVGVEDDKQYILLGDDGEVCYVPQAWMYGGNG